MCHAVECARMLLLWVCVMAQATLVTCKSTVERHLVLAAKHAASTDFEDSLMWKGQTPARQYVAHQLEGAD